MQVLGNKRPGQWPRLLMQRLDNDKTQTMTPIANAYTWEQQDPDNCLRSLMQMLDNNKIWTMTQIVNAYTR